MAKIEAVTFSKEEKERIRALDEDENWLNNLPPAKLKKYSGQYIAVRNRKIVASARSLDELYKKLDIRKIKIVTICMVEEPMHVVYGTIY